MKNYIWIVEVFDRDDRYCSSDYKIVKAFQKKNYFLALKCFMDCCERRTEEDDNIERHISNGKRTFCATRYNSKGAEVNCVTLRKMEVI